MSQTLKYLQEILAIPSPTGFTKEVQEYLLATTKKFGFPVKHTEKGLVIVTVKGKDDEHQRMVTAHVDTLGAMVRAVKPSGRLKLAQLGGYPWNMIEGENCLVHTADGKKIGGTILIHQTSCHVYKDAGTAERNQDNMEVRLDEKVTNEAETRALGIEVGDFVSFDPRTLITEKGFVKSRFLDDKASAAILLDILDRIHSEKLELPYVEFLACDMGAMGDDQQTDEYTVSICAKDSSGPYHYAFRQKLVNLAKEKKIPYRVDIYPYYGSDASAAMNAGAEIKHALLGAGIESSHSYERTNKESIDATEALVMAYLESPLVED